MCFLLYIYIYIYTYIYIYIYGLSGPPKLFVIWIVLFNCILPGAFFPQVALFIFGEIVRKCWKYLSTSSYKFLRISSNNYRIPTIPNYSNYFPRFPTNSHYDFLRIPTIPNHSHNFNSFGGATSWKKAPGRIHVTTYWRGLTRKATKLKHHMIFDMTVRGSCHIHD